jgi:sugar-phosphatase
MHKALPCQALVLDMDGVMLDSEPLWQQSEMEVFHAMGIPLTVEDCFLTTGLRVDEVVRYWGARLGGLPQGEERITASILDAVVGKIEAEAVPMPGLLELLEAMAQRGIPVALASSSPRRVIEAVVRRLGLAHRLRLQQSAEGERWGKPHPAVFLNTAEAQGLPPEKCLVVEDSFNGMVAALAARMPVVVMPAPHERHQLRWAAASAMIHSLEEQNTLLAFF